MLINDAGIYYYQKSKKRRVKKLPVVLLAIIIVLSWIAYVTYQKLTFKPPKKVAGVTSTKPLSTISLPPRKQDESPLGYVIRGALLGTKGRYGIVILNLKTGESYFENETATFGAASLYKLWVMATAYEQMRTGILHEGDVLKQDLDVLNRKFKLAAPSEAIGDEKDKDKKNIISFTVRDALMQMITISDNNAALLLSEKLRVTNMASFLEDQGFLSSRVGTSNEPSTTPLDVALFLKRLYEGKIVDEQSSEKMLQLLKWQKLNTKIPKYLPEDIFIAHKTAELDEYNHDAGIVYGPNGDYIIVVLSKSDIASRYLAEERIAILSREVYKYFNGN